MTNSPVTPFWSKIGARLAVPNSGPRGRTQRGARDAPQKQSHGPRDTHTHAPTRSMGTHAEPHRDARRVHFPTALARDPHDARGAQEGNATGMLSKFAGVIIVKPRSHRTCTCTCARARPASLPPQWPATAGTNAWGNVCTQRGACNGMRNASVQAHTHGTRACCTAHRAPYADPGAHAEKRILW